MILVMNMKTFRVIITETVNGEVYVQANNADEAYLTAQDMYADGDWEQDDTNVEFEVEEE